MSHEREVNMLKAGITENENGELSLEMPHGWGIVAASNGDGWQVEDKNSYATVANKDDAIKVMIEWAFYVVCMDNQDPTFADKYKKWKASIFHSHYVHKDVLDLLMTVPEAAAEFYISEQAIKKSIKEGKLQARKSGTAWLIRRADAEQRWKSRSQPQSYRLIHVSELVEGYSDKNT